MIETHGLTKVFKDKKKGEVVAVSDLSLTASPGRIYGLLGANGAGKTTALRMLATLLKPTAGNATVAGFDVLKAPEEVRRRVGFLAASTALYGRLTPREIIAYFGGINGMDTAAIRRRTEELVAALDMKEFIDRRIEKFSTGMKQKTSIARTIVHDPEVLIFDEPTLGLDVMASRSIMNFIRDCRSRGRTVIYSSHVMPEVQKLCDVIGIVHEGRLRAEGTFSELQARFGGADLEDVFVRVVGLQGE